MPIKQSESIKDSVLQVFDQKVSVVPDNVNWHEFYGELAQRREREGIDSPLFVAHVGEILKNYRLWNESMPNVDVFYAIKCNTSPFLIKTLAMLGAGFDCATKREMEMALENGASPQKIIYAHPVKPHSHIRFAKKHGVDLIVVDSLPELDKMKQLHPDARLVIRILTPIDTEHLFVEHGIKFGCCVTIGKKIIDRCKELHLNVVGISFHVGSGCQNLNFFGEVIRDARVLFDYAASRDISLTLLDVGGGFSATDQRFMSFHETAIYVRKSIEENFAGINNLRVIAEPGRFFATTFYSELIRINAKNFVKLDRLLKNKPTVDGSENSEDAVFYYTNDGIFNSFKTYTHMKYPPEPKPLKKPAPGTKIYKSRFYGPTCADDDVLHRCIDYPELDVGDWLVYENHGAYSAVCASDFNGFERPDVFYVIKESEREDFAEDAKLVIRQNFLEKNGHTVEAETVAA